MRPMLAVLFACALLAPLAPARAAHPTRCGTTWATADDCVLRLGGVRLRVTGTASATGTARVHVWLAPTVLGTQQAELLGCSGTGSKTASCTNEVLLPAVRDPSEEIVLDCRVEGTTGGTYRCETQAV